LGRQSGDCPSGVLPVPAKTVMQAEGPIRPEFDLAGEYTETSPERRAGWLRAVTEALFRRLGHQAGAAVEGPGLGRGPCPQPALQRTAGIIGIGLRPVFAGDCPAHPYLAAQRLPVHDEGGLAVRGKLPALGAFVIGVEN